MEIFNYQINFCDEITKINSYKTYIKYLKGKNGLEIGGPSPIFEARDVLPIYPIIKNLDGCNFSNETVWNRNKKKEKFYKYDGVREGNMFICDAIDLSEIPSNSYQFLLASHVLEHIANPLKAMKEWLRVLEDNGIILLILTHKDGNFDHKRHVTDFKHLIEDFEQDVGEDDLSHLPEILKLHDLKMDPPARNRWFFKRRSLKNYENRCLHQHVFDTKLATILVNYFKIKIISIDLILPYHIIILGKKTDFQKGDNDKFLDINADFFLESPFNSDRL